MDEGSAAQAPACPSLSAFRNVPAHVRLWTIAIAALVVDLTTKTWAFEAVEPDSARHVLLGFFSFRRSLNPGALFGLGRGLVPVFIAASVLALAFVVYCFANSSPRQWVLHAGLALILAGALGNLYDRLFVSADVVNIRDDESGAVEPFLGVVLRDDPGQPLQIGSWPDGRNPRSIARKRIASVSQTPVVRDFIKFEPRVFGKEVWPWVFNAADAMLVIGVGTLALHSWRCRGRIQPSVAP